MDALFWLIFFLVTFLASFALFGGYTNKRGVATGKTLGGCACGLVFGFVVLALTGDVLGRTKVRFEFLLLFLFAMFLGWAAATGLRYSREEKREEEQREERKEARRRRHEKNGE